MDLPDKRHEVHCKKLTDIFSGEWHIFTYLIFDNSWVSLLSYDVTKVTGGQV